MAAKRKPASRLHDISVRNGAGYILIRLLDLAGVVLA
jgi:hypothetical protein